MHVLAAHISCVCGPTELQDAIAQGYKEIYIITSQGTFKHHILRGEERFVRIKVDKVPGYVEPAIGECMNFLPAGKIPNVLYEQILGFFRKVMEVNVAEVEAMIHVLYNKERGYHLGVPPQTISKASVNYDWSYIPAGTSIVVDIHSHNTMSSFFSSTDNNDDKGNISFSGVFGKLKDKEPMTVWRFNYFDKKFNATVEDLFEVPIHPDVEIPKEWMDNVKVTTPFQYKGGSSYQGNVLPGQVTGRSHGQIAKWRYQGSPNQNGANQNTPAANGYCPSMDDMEPINSFFGGSDMFPEMGFDQRAVFNPRTGTFMEDPSEPDFGVNHQQEDALCEGLTEPDPVGKSGADGFIDGQYEAMVAIHGVDIADAWYSITTEMAMLDGKDEINEELIGDMLSLSSEDGQLKIFESMFQRLSHKHQIKLQTYGFSG